MSASRLLLALVLLTAALSLGSLSSSAVSAQTLSRANLCLIFYSIAGNPSYPWSSALSLIVQYNPTTVRTSFGTAVSLVSGSGTRTFTNKFGQSSSVNVSLVAAGANQNLLYLGSQFPFDSTGIVLALLNGQTVQLPGNGPLNLLSKLRYINQTAELLATGSPTEFIVYISEDASTRIDPQGSAFLSAVSGFENVTIGPSNINYLEVQPATCRAPITGNNGGRTPVSPTTSNAFTFIAYTYFVSDGATYTISGNLTLTTTGPLAVKTDPLGNQYQTIVAISGTRTYVYLPTKQTIVSFVTGLSSQAGASQRFYPYALLGASPGVYTVDTGPFVDFNGIGFNIDPPAPAAGVQPLNGFQFTNTTIHLESRELIPILVDGVFSPSKGFNVSGPTGTPLQALQQQSYTQGTAPPTRQSHITRHALHAMFDALSLPAIRRA